MSSRILVTGATGFIGRHLVRDLAAAGSRLLVVVRESSQLEVCEFNSDVQVVAHGGKPGVFQESMDQHSVRGVIHLASEYVKDDNAASIPSLVESNISFGAQVAEAASRAGAKWFLNVGTTWQHFRGEEGNAANLYAATKNSFEQILNYFQASRDLCSVNVYLGDTYGPGDRRGKILNVWRDAALDGRVVKMSPGQQRLNLLHVDDVCSALLLLVERFDRGLVPAAAGGRGFFLGPEDWISLRELAALFGEETGLNLQVDWGALPYRDREMMQPDVPFPRLPNWAARVPLRSGIRAVYSLI